MENKKMKAQITQIAVRTTRGISNLNTFGYETIAPGLEITRNIEKGKAEYSITHTKSGYRIFHGYSYITSVTKGRFLVKQFLTNHDWTHTRQNIQKDDKIKESMEILYQYIKDMLKIY